jgi:Kinesin motor domain
VLYSVYCAPTRRGAPAAKTNMMHLVLFGPQNRTLGPGWQPIIGSSFQPVAAGGHIPYRDSKLTRILQPSLGGNAKTAIICAITPAVAHADESHSTLRFASRAKRVVNNAVVNEVLSDAAVLKRQAKEIEELRKRLGASW